MRAAALTISCVLASTVPLFAGAGEITTSADELRAVQAQRFQAMIDADIEALDAILAEDLVYTHTTGSVDSKAKLVASIGAGTVNYASIEPSDINLRVFGNVAVIVGRAAMHVIAQGQDHILAIRFTEVYVNQDAGWQLVSWQSTRIL